MFQTQSECVYHWYGSMKSTYTKQVLSSEDRTPTHIPIKMLYTSQCESPASPDRLDELSF